MAKELTEKEVRDIEDEYKDKVWGNSYKSAIYASEASDKQKWYLNKLLRENGYNMMTGNIRRGMAQAVIWWLLEGKDDI